MPRDGNGTYSLPAGNPVVTGTTISSVVDNNTMNDVATALTDSLTKTGQTVPTANIPLGGFKITNLGNGSAATDAASIGQTVNALAASSGSSLVGFIQNGTGAVASTSQAELRRIWYPEQFGALGDGVTDDAAAWALLLTAVGSSNFEIHGKPGAIYLIGAAGISVANKTNGVISGNGAKIKLNAVATPTLGSFGATSIALDTCTRVAFTGWDIDGNAKASNLVGLLSCTDSEVSKNRTSSGGLLAHIFSLSGTRNSFLYNTVSSGSGTSRGLWIGNTNSGEPENDPIIRGNRVRSMGATGIGGTATGAIITGNHSLAHTAGSGIALGGVASPLNYRRTVIANNICRGMLAGHGIQSDATTDAQYTEFLDITGNVCEENSDSGIYAVRIRDCVISNNSCRDNNFDASGTASGITIDRAKRIVVSGNLCTDTRAGASRTQTYGIQVVAQVAALDIEDALLTGNMCRNNLTTGLYVVNANPGTIDGVSVVGNYTVDNGTNGVHITHAAAGDLVGITVVGNHCVGNGTSDLRVDPADAVISGNRYLLSPFGTLGPYTFTDLDTTPSVAGRRWFKAANTGATVITMFDDGVRDQEITILFTTVNTTVTDGGNIKLAGAANFVSTADDIMKLIFDGTNWYEVSRSVN